MQGPAASDWPMRRPCASRWIAAAALNSPRFVRVAWLIPGTSSSLRSTEEYFVDLRRCLQWPSPHLWAGMTQGANKNRRPSAFGDITPLAVSVRERPDGDTFETLGQLREIMPLHRFLLEHVVASRSNVASGGLKMKPEGMALALVLCAGATGCATITRGTAEDFTVESTPAGASVRTSTNFECASTPCTFHMPRKTGFTVTVSKPGFQTATATVTSGMSGAGGAGLAGNILVGGLIGIGVDATSGALNDLRPNPLHVDLTPTPGPAPATPVVAQADALGSPAQVASALPATTSEQAPTPDTSAATPSQPH